MGKGTVNINMAKNITGYLAYAIGICCMTIFPANIASSGEIVDRIVAVVNDDIVSLFEINQILKPYAEKLKTMNYPPEKEQEMLSKIREDILRKLIDEKLTIQETKRLGIRVSDEEINKALERIKEANSYTDEELREGLRREGMTLEEYRKRMGEQILRIKLVNYEIKPKIDIRKEDIQKYYENHKEEFEGETKYHLRNIILNISAFAAEDEKNKIKEKAEGVLTKLKAGASFEKMAKKHSELLADEGGDLGVFLFDDLSPQLQNAIKGKKAGYITPVIETDLGYQIFFVQEVIKANNKSFEDASAEIEEKLFNKIVDEEFQKWLEDLRKRSHIRIIGDSDINQALQY